MRYLAIFAEDVETAVHQIIPILEDTRYEAPKVMYFAGWRGGWAEQAIGASAVLRAIAERPPSSLREKFDKIIHLDCSRWESRRALQRAIADELKLTQQVAADFLRQDEEDDFAGVAQGSRAEIGSVAKVIARSLVQYWCLVVFHNGSDDIVDLTSSGVPPSQLFNTKVLWTYGGRFRFKVANPEDNTWIFWASTREYGANWNALVAEEAREIALYTHKHGLGRGVTPEIATECCQYLLSLHHRGGGVIDYDWTTHASSYWVCDGIIIGGGGGHGQDNDQAWELARALQRQIRVENYSSPSYEGPDFFSQLGISTRRWISTTNNSDFEEVPPGTTSLFFAPRKAHPLVAVSLFFAPRKAHPLVAVPSDRFSRAADQLRVLKLCRCTFSFSSPPFHCCRNLRFLGLESCEDDEEQQQLGARAVEIFQRLWVLDVRLTDWQLATATQDVISITIREVHIKEGRIWHSGIGLKWRRLPNLRKLRVVAPTSSWETIGRRDDDDDDDAFKDMVNLELLDLSGNSTIQALPSLSGATGLRTLVLDGCVGLEHVGPQGLPPSLESFSLDTARADDYHSRKENDDARISSISLAGYARLSDFRLRGPLPNLEELDLSHTAVKMLDLSEVVQVGNLGKVLLMGCEHLRSVSWPREEMDKLRLVGIDTRRAGGDEARHYSLMACHCQQGGGEGEGCHGFIGIADMRFLQSLVRLRKISNPFDKLNLCWSSSSSSKDDGGRRRRSSGHEMCHPSSSHCSSSTGQLPAGSPLSSNPSAYHDLCIDQMAAAAAAATQSQQAPMNYHMEIGEGVCDVEASTQSWGSIGEVMNFLESLHVHDSYSITTIACQQMFSYSDRVMGRLKWCCVERCPKLDTVFPTTYRRACFSDLETFWATHLLMARSIWSRPTGTKEWQVDPSCTTSFARLRAIHLYFCPRLRHVLTLSSNLALSKVLETLHILCCGDLRQVFPVEEEFLKKITAASHEKGMLGFPKLKDLYLFELPSLQHICEAKMFAPKLETIFVRGCWSLRRLPAATEDGRRPVAVDCEKNWWDKLEWDGMASGHHPSLYQPRHSRYYNYKRRHLRGTVLR